jgi:hypothetical protein
MVSDLLLGEYPADGVVQWLYRKQLLSSIDGLSAIGVD